MERIFTARSSHPRRHGRDRRREIARENAGVIVRKIVHRQSKMPGSGIRQREVVTAGGRVVTVTGGGGTFHDAIASAYAGVAQIDFDGMQYRRDIGQKALLEHPR